MNVIITGYAGFIGFHLTKQLIDINSISQIFCIDNFNNYYEVDLKYARHNEIKKLDINKKCKFFKIDLSNKKKLFDNMKNYKIDYIFNLAAQAGINYSISHPEKYIKSNIIGFFNIIELSKEKKIKSLFYASTSSVYGNLNKKKYAEKDLNNKPLQLYAATKISNEVLSEAYSNLYHFNSIGLRFFTVYGSWGRPDMAIFKFCKNIIK
jgi:UDP-glucuronate 4-epimerase